MSDDQKTARHARAEAARAAVLRALPAALLAWVGVLLLIYGAGFHKLPVLVEQQLELPPGLVPDMPFPFPPDQFPGISKRPEVVLVETALPEPAVVRDVTVGGVVRLDTGELKRTYSGDAPSRCPT